MTDEPSSPSDDTFPVPACDARVLLTTAPPDGAQDLAHLLVEERLAACVNLVPGVRSVYRWKGAIQDDPETQLVIKTTADRLPALAERLATLHPYEVPELLVLAPEGGSSAWLDWLRAQTGADPEKKVKKP